MNFSRRRALGEPYNRIPEDRSGPTAEWTVTGSKLIKADIEAEIPGSKNRLQSVPARVSLGL